MNYKIKKISGDASFREYYRVKKGKKTEVYKYLFKKMSRDKVRKNSVKKSLDLIKKFI